MFNFARTSLALALFLSACGEPKPATPVQPAEIAPDPPLAVDAAPAPDEDAARRAATELGLAPGNAALLDAIARRYGKPVQSVADMAAKAAELCVGGLEAASKNPEAAVRKIKGSLVFVAELGPTTMPLGDAFEMYAIAGCSEAR